MATHEKRIKDLENKVLKLEKWQIKVIAYFSIAIFVIVTTAGWLIHWILTTFADKILSNI